MVVMTDRPELERVRANLRRLMEQKDIAPTTLSYAVSKTNPTLVADLLTRTKDVKLGTLQKLAENLGVTLDRLISEDLSDTFAGPSLHVKGVVAAGRWVEAYEDPAPDWEVMTGRPDVRAPVSHRFFLRVEGDSMDEVYPPGSYIECVSLFGGAEATEGRRVVVMRQREDLMVEATVKELVQINGETWFVPRSSNPAHQAFKATDGGEGIDEVRILAVVVGSVRPE